MFFSQIAWNLAPEQEFHVTFVGLRAPNGEEIPFEVSDEVPWPHIPFWEEVIYPNEVYEILYEGKDAPFVLLLLILATDDRDADVDRLTEAEAKELEDEFDEMDTLKHGYLSREGLVRYFSDLYEKNVSVAPFVVVVLLRVCFQARNMTSNAVSVLGGGSRRDRGAKRIDAKVLEQINAEADEIMKMDVAGSGRIEVHEFARARAADVVVRRTTNRRSTRGDRLSTRITTTKR